MPYIDPNDGGTGARALFVLEAPGPRARASGFVSRDNPSLTGRYMRELQAEAGLRRADTLIWNVVPWYLGDGRRIRPATDADIAAGLVWLERLLALLPALAAVVLVGRKAQRARGRLPALERVALFEAPHPSPQFVHFAPGNRARVLDAFKAVAAFLYGA